MYSAQQKEEDMFPCFPVPDLTATDSFISYHMIPSYSDPIKGKRKALSEPELFSCVEYTGDSENSMSSQSPSPTTLFRLPESGMPDPLPLTQDSERVLTVKCNTDNGSDKNRAAEVRRLRLARKAELARENRRKKKLKYEHKVEECQQLAKEVRMLKEAAMVTERLLEEQATELELLRSLPLPSTQ
jgi:hypothetical protein